MPIYEYLPVNVMSGCPFCSDGFELFRKVSDPPVTNCPQCKAKVRKKVSLCRAAIVDISEESKHVEQQIKRYEKEGMHSHAAELADTVSEKTGDTQLKNRARDNYKKAGYDISD